MTSSYNDNIQAAGAETPINQYPLFQDPQDGDTFTSGSRVWVYNGADKKWDLQHIVVRGDETIKQGPPGSAGKSAYEIWLDLGNNGTEQDFIDSLKGDQGEKGDDGDQGETGENGESIQGEAGQGQQGEKGDPGFAHCEISDGPPDGGERGKLWIDSMNQIYVTLG